MAKCLEESSATIAPNPRMQRKIEVRDRAFTALTQVSAKTGSNPYWLSMLQVGLRFRLELYDTLLKRALTD